MADRDNRRSRVAAFASLPATRLGMFADSGNRQSQNVEDVTGATMLDKILASIPASAQGYAGDVAWLYRQGQLRPWRQTVGEHMQEASRLLPKEDTSRGFAEGGTVDDILSAYSEPVRSWPGEQALDDEARANYAAMHPEAPRKLRPDEAFRGTFLPFRETTEGKHEWAVPGFLMDVADAAKAIHASSGTSLGPAIRPSQYSPEAFEQILGHGMAGALAGIAGNMPRVLAKPSVGATELGIFGGRSARTADQAMLAKAEDMAAQGVPREQIWKDTGWFQGVDGKWRFEIDDSQLKPAIGFRDWIDRKDGVTIAPHVGAAVAKAAESLTPEAPVRLKRVFEHPDLDRAYPVGFTKTPEHPSIMGMPLQLIEGGNTSGAYIPDGWKGMPSIALHETLPPGTAKQTLLHELQHAVQQKEGFQAGGNQSMGREYLRAAWDRQVDDLSKSISDMMEANPSDAAAFRRRNAAIAMKDWDAANAAEVDLLATDVGRSLSDMDWRRNELYRRDATKDEAFNAYKALAGEIEAKAVENRMRLTPEERRSRPPWLDYDIPESQQIVRFGDKGPQMSMSDDASRPPLPMDEASRLARAREMGFDTESPFYRGVAVPVNEDGFAVSQATGLAVGPGVYIGNRPTASGYATQWSAIDNATPAVYGPLYTRGKLADIVQFMDAEDAARKALPKNKRKDDELVKRHAQDILKAQGYTGVTNGPNGNATVAAVFDPRDLRSGMATFDPAKADSSNLLASHHIPLPVPREDDRTVEDILNLYTKD